MAWMLADCSRLKLSGWVHVCCAAGRDDVADTNFLEWLRDTVYEAVKIAERHESLKLRIREARANIEHRYQLASLQVRQGALVLAGGCLAVVQPLRQAGGSSGTVELAWHRSADASRSSQWAAVVCMSSRICMPFCCNSTAIALRWMSLLRLSEQGGLPLEAPLC